LRRRLVERGKRDEDRDATHVEEPERHYPATDFDLVSVIGSPQSKVRHGHTW
jgi:hypothetical protein